MCLSLQVAIDLCNAHRAIPQPPVRLSHIEPVEPEKDNSIHKSFKEHHSHTPKYINYLKYIIVVRQSIIVVRHSVNITGDVQ